MDPEPTQQPKPSVATPDVEPSVQRVGDAAVDAAMVSASVPASNTRGLRARPKAGTQPNNVKKLRQRSMMSKAELARRAGVSPLTIDRVEAGCPCRMDTKRKILEALGLEPSAAHDVFPDVDLG